MRRTIKLMAIAVLAGVILGTTGTYSGLARVNIAKISEALKPLMKTETTHVVELNPEVDYTNRTCEAIEYNQVRDKCYYALALKNAKTTPRESLEACERIMGLEVRVDCIKKLGETSGNTMSKCEKKADVVERNTCLRDDAIDAAGTDAVEAEKFCDLIENQLRQDWCYIEIASQIVRYNHTEAGIICNRVFGENQRTECLTDVAEKLARTSLNEYSIEYCGGIPNDDKKNYCKAKVVYVTSLSKAMDYCNKIKDNLDKQACITYVGGRGG